MADSKRRLDLDRAKGLGILLVVFGHIVARTPPQNNEWYVVLKSAIYLFHMPFFLYLSGYVFFLSGAARTAPADWKTLFAKRTFRLLVPFLLFSLLILGGKLIAARFVFVDNLPGSFSEGIGFMWRDSERSPALSVWYIFVLFVFSLATPPLMLALKRTYLLVAVTALLYLVPLPSVMFLDRVGRFYIFFALGGLAAEAGAGWLTTIDRFGWLTGILLVAALITALFGNLDLPNAAGLLVCGVLSMPALHGLVRARFFNQSKVLLTLGVFSFVIYLLNTICIGLVKGLLLKIFPWDGFNFLIYLPLLLAAGLIGPILIKRVVLRRVKLLDGMTD